MTIRKIIMITTLLLLMCLFSGCDDFSEPPDLNSVEQRFNENYDDIMKLVEYMSNTDYEHIYISDNDGTMLVGTTDMDIEDNTVIDAIDNLIGRNKYLSICKHGFTIEFRQSHNFFDVACGVAYLINDSETLEIQFLTEYEPLSESGWYYYVADYEEWRVKNTEKISETT